MLYIISFHFKLRYMFSMIRLIRWTSIGRFFLLRIQKKNARISHQSIECRTHFSERWFSEFIKSTYIISLLSVQSWLHLSSVNHITTWTTSISGLTNLIEWKKTHGFGNISIEKKPVKTNRVTKLRDSFFCCYLSVLIIMKWKFQKNTITGSYYSHHTNLTNRFFFSKMQWTFHFVQLYVIKFVHRIWRKKSETKAPLQEFYFLCFNSVD